MRNKTLTAVSVAALTHDFDSLESKLEHVAKLFEAAVDAGSDLVVFPEALNHFCGNYPNAKTQMHFAETALENWTRPFAKLIALAQNRHTAVVLPVVVRDSGTVANRFYFVDRNGEIKGHYQKSIPTPTELSQGVAPGHSPPIEWEGIRIGGAICFDVYHPAVFERQAAAGAELFLVPSFTAGGIHLNYYAIEYSTPIVLAYPQWSRIIDMDGIEISQGGFRNETLGFGYGPPMISATINFNRIALFADHNQTRINDVLARYRSRVRVSFNQPNALFVLESRDVDLDIREVAREFDLIPRREYFARSCAMLEQQIQRK